jgi:hypothetical protein
MFEQGQSEPDVSGKIEPFKDVDVKLLAKLLSKAATYVQ